MSEEHGEIQRRVLAAQRDSLRQVLAGFGQGHLFDFFEDLNLAQQKLLLDQVGSLDIEQLKDLFERTDAATDWRHAVVEPAEIVSLPKSPDEFALWQRAKTIGEEALRAGHVAVLLVAGGQGTRLGFDGPKGTFGVGSVSGNSLFQIHAEKILATGHRYAAPITLLVMTSPDNSASTKAYFAEKQNFGLEADRVIFFEQGQMPAVDRKTGRLLLAEKHALALSPDGHGGVVAALAKAGILDELDRRGVRHLFYFQVDNPMVTIADPTMIGHHLLAGAEFSLKVIRKVGPTERVGNIVRHAGCTVVIEYSDLPDELAHRKDADGNLAIWAGNMGVHLFDVAFVRRIVRSDDLPFHRALKKTPFVDATGATVNPEKPNAYKFERFIFDAFPLAQKALPIETARAEEFEPVKNAEGENSPATARQAMSNLFGTWLEDAGVKIPRTKTGDVKFPIEISPLFALDREELTAKLPADFKVDGPVFLHR